MNDLQIDALIEKIVKKITAEMMNNKGAAFPSKVEDSKNVYVIMPEAICPIDMQKAETCLKQLKKNYKTTLVVSDKDFYNLETEKIEADRVMKRCDTNPDGVYAVVFLSASRNLIVKTALCLGDCFESRIATDAIEKGQSVYMYKEKKELCDSAPLAYRKMIEGYERQLLSYGVSFDKLPYECLDESGGKKRNIITADDIKKVSKGEKVFIYSGDIITEIAKEAAEDRNIELVYC